MKANRGRPVLLLVLLLVNAAAVWGQAGWALDHIVPVTWAGMPLAGLALSLGFALAIETIGVFLALSADHAEDRDIPAGGIRLGSYAIGLVSGALNASHWGWTSAAAIAFALLSAISPFLWGIHSRVNRERTIPPSRRFWHPRRSVALIRHMAWEGIATEQEGITSMKALAGPIPAFLAPARDYTPAEEAEMVEMVKQFKPMPIPAAPVSPAAPRQPRAPKEAQEKAVRMLLDGASVEEAAAATGLSAATLRLYGKAQRLLLAAPAAVIGPKLDGRSINPALVEIIRAWANTKGRTL